MGAALSELKQRHLRGDLCGLTAVCSSHPVVLRTALELARDKKIDLLVEATANQVNPYGGYTGMRPDGFVEFIKTLVHETGFSGEIMIGADHLGPHPWKLEPAAAAMQKSEELVRQCIRAGFQKIHLDTAVTCADDPGPVLPLDRTVERAARLCRVAEDTFRGFSGGRPPVYVIGTEVPVPGGALEQGRAPVTTEPDDLFASLGAYEEAFAAAGVAHAWQRVLAVVVQPGVDFGDRRVARYRPERAASLSAAHDRLPGMMTYEIHATDYQDPADLHRMVADHFALLKVGPCLTFALRQALFALADIESALPHVETPSHLKQVMEDLMTERPRHWRALYAGSPAELGFLRQFSLRDRIRYYWSFPQARAAVQQLLHNLHRRNRIPSALLQQYLPDLYPEPPSGERSIDAENILEHRIRRALAPYFHACGS